MKKINLLLIIMIVCLCGCGKKEKLYTQISLVGNITTGYEWTCNIKDETVVKKISEEYIPNSVENGVAGSGGYWIIVLEGLKEDGKTLITCEYARSFEDVEPLYKINYNVKVDEEYNISVINKSGTYESEIIPGMEKTK